MAPPITDGWTLWPWSRVDPDAPEPDPIPEGLLDDIEARLAGHRGRGDTVKLPSWVVQLLVDNARPAPMTAGAVVVDTVRGAQYRATIQRSEGVAQLASVEVSPIEPGATLPAGTFRVPGKHIADAVSGFLAQRAAAEARSRQSGGDGGSVLFNATVRKESATPTAEELRELVRAGLNRGAIASRYGRAISTVDQWLRKARRDRPDLDWPERRRGPAPRSESLDVDPSPSTDQ